MDETIHDVFSQFTAECTAAPKKEPKEPKVDEGGGTYAGVKFDKDTIENLTDYLTYLTTAMGLKEPIDPEDFHTTIVYSRKTVPSFKPASYDEATEITPKKNRGYRLELFGPDKTTLVLTYRSPLLQERFDTARKLGATSDYSDYCPHVTLGYNATKAAAKGAKWLKQFKLPEFPLLITEEYVEPIDEDWQDKAKDKDDKSAKKEVKASLRGEGRFLLIAYFQGDLPDGVLHEETATKWAKPSQVKHPLKQAGLFTKSGRQIAEGLLKEANGDAGLAIKKLIYYRNRAGKSVPNAGALDTAQAILHRKLTPVREAAE